GLQGDPDAGPAHADRKRDPPVIDPIDTSLLPPDVRKAGPADQKLYAGALAFEQQLTEQLAQSLSDSAQAAGGSDDDEDGPGDPTTSMYKQMLPQAMAQ